MTRSNRNSAPQSRFPHPPSAVAATAIVLGALMALSNTGLASAAYSAPHDSPVLSSPRAAFPDNVRSPSLPPTSPLLGYDVHTDLSSHSTPSTSTSSSATSSRPAAVPSPPDVVDTRLTSFRSDQKKQPESSIPDTKTLDDSHGDHQADPHHRRARRSRGHKRLFQHGIGRSKNSYLQSRQASSKTYAITKTYQGQSFFSNWDFFHDADPTHGSITYVSGDIAKNLNLAYVQDDGVAVMTVDTNSNLNPGQPRNSIRITSKQTFNQGLFIFDILRAPHGCAVWPAAWLVGPSWPQGGEIDVIEGVHESQQNQMTLHTGTGCTLDQTRSIIEGAQLAAGLDATQLFSGTVLQSDCDAYIPGNAGCGVVDTDSRSYGAGLNSVGGGVYATLWNEEGVRIWFFPRDSVPADISNQSPDPSSWGTPKAFWDSASCPSSFFSNLSIVFDIVLGGDWAGATFNQAGCPGNINDYIANPNNFANANWAINSVKVYQ